MATDRDEAAERLRQIQEGIRNGSITVQLPATARPENFPNGNREPDTFDVTAVELEAFAHAFATGIVIRYGIRDFGFGELAFGVRHAAGDERGASREITPFADTEELPLGAIAAILQAAAPELARLLRATEAPAPEPETIRNNEGEGA